VNAADISVGVDDFELDDLFSSDIAGAGADLDDSIDIGKDENVFAGGAKTPTKGKGKTPGMRQTAMAAAAGKASENGFDGLFDKFVKRRLSEKFKQSQILGQQLPKNQLDEEENARMRLQDEAKKKASLVEKEKERERQKQLERERTVKAIQMMREKEKKEKERKEQEKAKFASVLTPTKKRPGAVASASITRLQLQEVDTSVDVEEVSVLIEIPIVNIDEEIDNLIKSKSAFVVSLAEAPV